MSDEMRVSFLSSRRHITWDFYDRPLYVLENSKVQITIQFKKKANFCCQFKTFSYPANSRRLFFIADISIMFQSTDFFIGLFEEHAADIDIIMENTKPKALEVQEPPRTRRSARLDQKRNPGFGSSSRSPTKDSFKRRKSGAGINESLYGGIETSDREESEAEEVEEPEVEQKVPTSKKILQK